MSDRKRLSKKSHLLDRSWSKILGLCFLISMLLIMSISVIAENNPPGIAIAEPENGATVSGTITIWMVAWDPDGNDQIQDVWVRIDGGSWRNATYNHTDAEGQWWFYEWDTTEVDDGWHHITAIVFDGMDYGDDLIEVYVDNIPENNPPGIAIVEPEDGATVSGTITIWMVAWDPDGNDQIQDVWIRIDWGPLRNATYNHTDAEGQWWYYEWDTTEVEDGWHVITAVTFDGIDDAHDVIEVFVDNVEENHPPGIEITQPENGAEVSGTITILMVAWDPDGNDQIQDVWVRIDGGSWRNATYNHTDAEGQWWYYEWDTTEVDDGWHHITAIVFDGMDYGDDLIEVYVDNIPENNPPGIAIVEPEGGATVSGTITIWMVAWDPDGNDQIQDVWVRIDWGPLHNATYNHTDAEGQWWYYEWDTTEVEDGWHHITAIVFDGIAYGDDHIEVFVDNVEENHPPGIEVVEPENGATVSGVIAIWMVAWDPDGNDQIQNVWVRIDDGELRNATFHHEDQEGLWYYYKWNTTEVDDGWHLVTAIVYDGIDDGHDHIELFVDNAPENHPPGIEIVEPEDGATVGGTITIWMVAWDPDGNDQIQQVLVKIDGGELRNATFSHIDAEGSWWYYKWDTTEVEDGWHLITAIVYDGIDDGHDHIEVLVDNVPENHPPGIEIIEPDNGATVSGVITIWMVAWDPDGNDQIQDVWVRIDGGHWQNATYSHTDAEGQWWYYKWDTTKVEDGWHHITAIVYDGIAYGDDHIEVFVDNIEENHAPRIEIMEPEDGATVSGIITIWMVAWDPDGNDQIQNVWVRIDYGGLRNATFHHEDQEGLWYYYEWDTTEVDDGWHLVTAIVYDGIDDGHNHIEVYVDNVEENHPPGIEIIEPENGATVSGVITIWMVAWDPDGNDQIQDVWVRIDDGELRNATFHHEDQEGLWYYYEWDTTEVEDGWHLVTAIAYDGIDDGHDHIEVFVDNSPENHPPGIEIVEPEDGATVSGTITIWMVAWDLDGHEKIQNVWVRIDHGELREATFDHIDGEGSWWYYEWDTTEVEDGWHLVTAIAYDGIDDGHDHIEVFVDNVPENHPPGIEIVDPKNGATVSETITIWMVAWDPDGNDQIQQVWVRIDGGDWLNATYSHTDAEGQWWFYEWDTTEVEDGCHHITAIVYDGLAYGDDHIEVFVDNMEENHAPGIEIVEPEDGATVSGTITIWMVAWDPDGNDQIQNVWVKIDGGELRNATFSHVDAEGSWWYYEWDTTEVEDGWHLITAIAYDGIDDGHDHIEVFVDNVPENHPPGIEIVEPEDGATVSRTIAIWMIAWDPDGNDQIQDVWVRIDGGDWLNATYSHTDAEGQWWFYEWDTTEVEDGWHHITAIVFDGIAYGDDHIEVFVDNVEENHPPGIEVVEPENGATVSGVIAIWMVAWDPDGNDQIQNVWVRIDGGELRNATFSHVDAEGSWWFYEWDTTEVEDGWHLITAIVYDGIDDGHDHIEVYVHNEEENHAPGIEIVEPEDGATVSGVITIWMVAWDPDGNDQIQEVWVRIDSGELRNATFDHVDAEGSWWFYEWDTTEVEMGWHLITAIAYDGIDDAHDSIEVLVDNEEILGIGLASPSRQQGSIGVFILMALVGIVMIGAFSATTGTEVGKFALFKFIGLPLYTRVGKKDVLDHFVRGEIFGYIKIHPGDNYTTIKNNLELNNGSLTYHLSVLEREGFIKSWSNNGHKYFYPKGVKIPGNGVKNPSIYDAILKSIRESPGISIKDIAAVTGISSQLANYHVRKLAAEGFIELERKSLWKVCYPKECNMN